MSLLTSDISGFLSPFTPAVATRSSPISSFDDDSKRKKVFDHLIDWGSAAQNGVNPFEFPAPTLASVKTAVKLVTEIGYPVPDAPSVVPNGDGGISFEWEKGSSLLHMDIDDLGNIEITIFSGVKIVYSHYFDARLFQ